MSDKLKPCPFCGREAHTFHIPENTNSETKLHPKWTWNNPGLWVIGCATDDCLGCLNNVSMVFVTEQSAITAWNRRAADAIENLIIEKQSRNEGS